MFIPIDFYLKYNDKHLLIKFVLNLIMIEKIVNKYNKKGQGLTLNVIVIALLVIIVLVVLIVNFTQNINKSQDGVNEVSDSFKKNCDKATNPILRSYDQDILDGYSEIEEGNKAEFVKIPLTDCYYKRSDN